MDTPDFCREIMKLMPIAAAVLVLALAGGEAAAQQAKGLRDQLVGTWQFVVAEVTAPDGKKSFPFGESPKGHPCLHAGRPFRADPRRERGAEDRVQQPSHRYVGRYAGIMRGSLSVFGTYTVDEDKKTVTYRIVSSTFPNWEGVSQTRVIRRPYGRRVPQYQPERRRRTRECGEYLQASEVGAM
jgi:lipocalin-like protein